jgi:hypothetical protein
MKSTAILLLLASTIFFSCNKSVEDIPSSLEGTWKMIQVKDNITNATVTKPSSILGDVIITFTPSDASSGTFRGNTPINTIEQNTYSLGADQAITIPVLSMTKVAETSWGTLFVDHITYAQRYGFEPGNKLTIVTIGKSLTFEKQ